MPGNLLSQRMKKPLVIAGLALVLLLAAVSAWCVRSQRAEESREAAYRAVVADFEGSFRLGMPRAEVEKFLISRKVNYSPRSEDIYTRVGLDPHFLCDATVYVVLEFNHLPRQVEPAPLDTFKNISIMRF